ncbi:unnamed protein product [Moneuplotes crassus]|uniref:Uncharacterized protein n=1 Tax=Euplotes crassus TaxID=5936 RepID=A0AAD1Y619_EUPCR|nr:unnamed protein product [Moneuplotes crassus]
MCSFIEGVGLSEMSRNKGVKGCLCCLRGVKNRVQSVPQRPEFFKKFKNPDDPRLMDLVKRFNKYSTNDEISLEQYRRMMGILGNTYFTERMFSAMDQNKNNKIDLEEYITYNNVILNGTISEKREQNFSMIDDNTDAVVTKEEFQKFVINILDMYSKADRERIESNKGMIDEVFEKIVPPGKAEFTFDDYMKALEDNPDLFIWLERPKEMLSDILNKEEGKYSKKFVDDLIDLFFKYIATTEFSIRKILRAVKQLQGKSDIESASEQDNFLLNLTDPSFNRGRGGYYEVLKTLTKDVRNKPTLEATLRFDKKAKSQAFDPGMIRNRDSVAFTDIDEGGNGIEEYEESQVNDESDEELKDHDESVMSRSSLAGKAKTELEMLSNKKLEKQITLKLKNESEDPLENIQNVSESMVDVCRSLDIQLQERIDKETNRKSNKAQKQPVRSPPEEIYKEEDNEDDLPEEREFIDFGHERFDLVFNIMLGIKRSIDCQFSFAFLNTRDNGYVAKYEYKNEWFSTNNSASNEFVFIDYAPKIFEDIRIKDGIENNQYIESLGPDNIYNYIWTNDFKTFTSLVSSGKSGSLFYYSMDGKFMLKTIARDEFYKLLSTLKKYHDHLCKYPESLLTRYYGLYKIKYKESGIKREQYIIIMNNMFRKFSPGVKYDLKGSIQGRKTSFKYGKIDPKIALKDNDWTERGELVYLKAHDKRKLMQIIKADSDYLGDNQTLDYSLLLGIIDLDDLKEKDQNDPVLQYAKTYSRGQKDRGIYISDSKKQMYIVGIIDTLTNYSTLKQLEYYFKRCKHGHKMSCIPPTMYAERFYDFMVEKVFG